MLCLPLPLWTNQTAAEKQRSTTQLRTYVRTCVRAVPSTENVGSGDGNKEQPAHVRTNVWTDREGERDGGRAGGREREVATAQTKFGRKGSKKEPDEVLDVRTKTCARVERTTATERYVL